MKNALFFTSGKGNSYLYSPYRNQFRLCHPFIPFFFQLDKKDVTLNQWLSSIRKKGKVCLDGVGTFSYAEAKYQLGKYRFLKKHGFLKPAKAINLEGRLKVADVKKNIESVKQLIFEVTEDCNLNCTYCTYSKYYINKERTNKYLSFEEAKPTLMKLIAKRTPSPLDQLIISFYGGEPLVNFAFIKSVVDFTSTYPKDQITFKYTMSSNGLLLKKHIQFLVDHAFEVSVSLDGDEIANSFRVMKNGKPSYNTVTKNLDFVKEHYPDYFEQKINFLTVLHNRNSFSGVFEYFKNKYDKIPMMSEVNPLNLTPEHKKEFNECIRSLPVSATDEKQSMKSIESDHPKVKDMAKMAENYSGFVFKNYLKLISPTTGKFSSRKSIPTATCTPFSIRAYFTTHGAIIPCEHISTSHEIGHYSYNQLRLNPKEIASLYNGYYDKLSRFCNTCYFADNCQDCIFNTGIEQEKPTCEFYTGESGFRKYLKEQYSSIENDYTFFLKTAQKILHEE